MKGARRLVLAAIVARMPLGIVSLATVLLAREATGSYADAGVVVAANAIGMAAGAPVLGRLIDRRGQRGVLLGAAGVEAAALVALAVAGEASAPALALAAPAVVAGLAVPPVSACMRALWTVLLDGDEDRVASAYALESVLVEVLFIGGPLLAALLIAVASPAAALLVAAALLLAGTATFSGAPACRAWRPPTHTGRRASALSSPGVRTLLATIVPAGATLGLVELSVVAFAGRNGGAAWAGVVMGAMALGSMAGGLWYGARTWRSRVDRRFIALAWLFALGLAPLALAQSLPALIVLIALAGAALAPVTACVYVLLGRVAAAGAVTEANTWLITANIAGSAAGAALAGVLVEHGDTATAFLVAAGTAALAAMIALAGRRTLVVSPGR